jgi:single-strand DNA-binding protein
MFDTTVTIVGNALNAPELRRTNSTNTLVASFRVASTSRRYDKDSGRWVDGPSLRVRVTCWRRLAEGVNKCVVTGDPLVVTGRMYTRDWVGDDGQHRVSYELEAIAVGHDLSRGFAKFTRYRPNVATSAVEDAESDARIAGEASVPVSSKAPAAALSPATAPERADDDDLSMPDSPTPTFEPPPVSLTDSYGEFVSVENGDETDGGDGDETDGGDEESGEDGARSAEEDAMSVLRAAGVGGGSAEPGSAEPGSPVRAGGRRGLPRVPVPA